MAASAAASVKAVERASAKDVGFAVGIVFILTVLFLPLPATFIDIGLSFSIARAVFIFMV
jgi:flagellar biosynthesis protein FlhA